jgi:hypothetical protein
MIRAIANTENSVRGTATAPAATKISPSFCIVPSPTLSTNCLKILQKMPINAHLVLINELFIFSFQGDFSKIYSEMFVKPKQQ